MWSSREDSEEKSPPAESATRRRQSAPRINGGLFCPGARTNLAQNFAVRVILVRITSMWAFRVLARVGPRGRRLPVTNKPSFIPYKVVFDVDGVR